VISYKSDNEFFQEKTEIFSVMRFLLELTQHIPPRGSQYIRRYGLYASRTKGKWPDIPHVVRLAPAGWKAERLQVSESLQPAYEESTVFDQESRRTWAKLIAQVYEVDPMTCSRCGSPMRILAVITEPEEVRNDPCNQRLPGIWSKPVAHRPGSISFRLTDNLSPSCSLRRPTLSPLCFRRLPKVVLLALSARSNSREVGLSGGFALRGPTICEGIASIDPRLLNSGVACPPQIITLPITHY